MGTQFFWFYDILTVGIILAITFRCFKKGFVSVIVRFAAVLAAFLLAAALSGPASAFIYDNFVAESVTHYINDGISNLGDGNVLFELSQVDTDKIKINGVPVTELSLEPDSAGKITLDISNLDLSETGLAEIDLSLFGMDSEKMDFSKVNAGKINITPDELSQHSAGIIVLSKTLSQSMQSETSYGSLVEMLNDLSEMVPFFSGDVNLNDSVAKVIRVVIDSGSGDVTSSVVSGLVRPMIMPVIKAVAFFVIFITVSLLLTLLARALKLVNRVPVIGGINSLFGAVVGVIEGVIVVMLVCVFIHIIIALTGNAIVLLNSMTIDNTIVFKYFYNNEFLSIR